MKETYLLVALTLGATCVGYQSVAHQRACLMVYGTLGMGERVNETNMVEVVAN